MIPFQNFFVTGKQSSTPTRNIISIDWDRNSWTTRTSLRKTSRFVWSRGDSSSRTRMFGRFCNIASLVFRVPAARFLSSTNKKLDFSKVPKLVEADLEETFVRGDGPGGQAIATTNNCVLLRHRPTNIVVKNHGTRSLQKNREEARRLMVVKLDGLFNKEESIESQRKRLDNVRRNKAQSKSEKLRKLKMEFKKNLEEKQE